MLVSLHSEHIHDSDCGCAACGKHSHGQFSRLRLRLAGLGAILVFNSYIASVLFAGSISAFAIEFSAIIGAALLGAPIIGSAIKDLLKGKIYMNELVALAILAAFAKHDYRTAGAVAFFMLIGILIEQRTAVGAEASIEALVRLTPRRARRLLNGSEQEVDALELSVGDVVRVRPGENFPADGRIITGSSTVNQASITGESLPVDKNPNDDVFAGTQNLTGMIEAKVIRVGADTTLGKVRDLIVAAEKSRLPIMRMIDRYVGFYTPTVLMIAALVWFFSRDMNRVIAVLVMACPCALIIATPSALIAAIASAARLGVLVKDVNQLEWVARIKVIIFDKTGTLTEGNLEVAKLDPAPGVELAELLQIATAAEAHSNHPAAEAMRRLAKDADLSWDEPTHYEEVAGRGVVADCAGVVARVGRESWLRECGLDTSHVRNAIASGDYPGMSIVVVASNDRILGWIGLRDAVRVHAGDAISWLKQLGVNKCCMVTGDNDSVAKLVARKVGISEIKAHCLPQEKVDAVELYRRGGNIVAVVGDGVNDAPALAAGDIGIAMGAIGSDVAVQSASIALMNNDLRRIPFLISLARRTRAVMTQNLLVGTAIIAGGLYLAGIGQLPPVAAAFLHVAGSLLIVFNSARLVRSGEELEQQDRAAAVASSSAPPSPPPPLPTSSSSSIGSQLVATVNS